MKKMIQRLWNDEGGFIISMELVLIATILVLGLVAGMVSLRDQLNAELADLGQAIGSIDQSFAISGEAGTVDTSGSASTLFADAADTYDIAAGPTDAGGNGLTVSIVGPPLGTEAGS
jgi:Flp pilus assembly pilin Flp